MAFTSRTTPESRFTLMPCGWLADLVSMRAISPSVNSPVLWWCFCTTDTLWPILSCCRLIADMWAVILLKPHYNLSFHNTQITMYFAVISTDVADSLPLRMPVRAQHLARLNELKEAKRLLIAGPHPATDEVEPEQLAFTGSLVVAEFDSLQAAQEWADADPYVAAGVYAEVVVKPFLKVLP